MGYGFGKGVKLTKAAKAAAEKAAKKAAKQRASDVTLPPGTTVDDPGAGPLRPGQRPLGRATEGDQLTAKERNLRDDYFALTPNRRRSERVKGSDSRYAPYFVAQRRLERQAKEVEQPEVGDRDPTIIRKRTSPRPPREAALGPAIGQEGRRIGPKERRAILTREERKKEIERIANIKEVEERLKARGGDETGMKEGGLKTRKQTKAVESYKTYVDSKKAREKAARKRKSAKRKNITASMSAARGGLMKPIHKDYRKGGLFKKGK